MAPFFILDFRSFDRVYPKRCRRAQDEFWIAHQESEMRTLSVFSTFSVTVSISVSFTQSHILNLKSVGFVKKGEVRFLRYPLC